MKRSKIKVYLLTIALLLTTIGAAACGGSDQPAPAKQGAEPATTAASDASNETSAPAAADQGTQVETKTEAPATSSDSAAPTADKADGLVPTLLPDVKADKSYRFGFALSRHDTFLDDMWSNMMKACKAQNITLDTVSADNNGEAQLSQISQFAEQGYDCILVNPATGSSDAHLYIEAAKDIPIVFVNREPTGPLTEGKQTYVGCDETAFGKAQGEYLAKYFKDKGKTEVSYVMLRGIDGLSNTQQRADGALNAMKEGGLKLTDAMTASCNFFREHAYGTMMNFIVTETPFDCVIAANDDMALGAIQAMKDFGLDPKSIPVCGIDATKAGREAVEKGDMAITVLQDPLAQGVTAANAAIALAQGEKIPTKLTLDMIVMTKENVGEYLK